MKRIGIIHGWGLARLEPQFNVDRMITLAKGRFTALAVGVQTGKERRDWQWLGECRYVHSRPDRIGDLTILQYFIQQAHAHDLRVLGEVHLGLPSTWRALVGGLSIEWTTDSLPEDGPCRPSGGPWMNLWMPEVQDMMAQAIGDLVQKHPGLNGIKLDFVRGSEMRDCPRISAEHITELVTKIGQAVDVDLYADVAPRLDAVEHDQQDPWTWLRDELVQGVTLLGKSWSPELRLEFVHSLPPGSDATVGININAGEIEPAQMCEEIRFWTDRGLSVSLFSLTMASDEVLAAIPLLAEEDGLTQTLRELGPLLRSVADRVAFVVQQLEDAERELTELL